MLEILTKAFHNPATRNIRSPRFFNVFLRLIVPEFWETRVGGIADENNHELIFVVRYAVENFLEERPATFEVGGKLQSKSFAKRLASTSSGQR